MRTDRRRWVVVVVATLAYLVSFLDRLGWSGVAAGAAHDFGLPIAALGAFTSLFFVGYLVSSLLGGFVVDRFGARRTLVAALVPLGLLTIGFGLVRSVAAAAVIQLLMGLAAGVDFAACMRLIAERFERVRRASATGVLMMASSAGVLVVGLVAAPLTGLGSWAWVFVVFGAVTLLVAAAVLVVVGDVPTATVPDGPAWRAAVPTLVRTPRWLLLALGGFGALWGTWGTTTWMQNLMILGHGLTPSRAGLVVSAFGLGAVVAKPVIGAVCDRLGAARVVPMVVILALFTLGLLGFGFLTTAGGFLTAAPLLGVVAFGYSPLMNSMVTEVVPDALVGAAAGLANGVWQVGSVLAPLAVGAVFAASGGSFPAVFATLAAGPLVAVPLCWLLGRVDEPAEVSEVPAPTPDADEGVSPWARP
jgi:sugar phosphate permease